MTGTNQKFSKLSKGFTLVELIVVLAVFLFIIGVAITIFLSIITNQKSVLAEQKILNQISYVEEHVSKALRMAKKDTDGACLQNEPAGTLYPGFTYLFTGWNSDPEIGQYTGIRFINQSDINQDGKAACVEFYWDVNDNVLKERKFYMSAGATMTLGSEMPLTSEDLEIQFLKFAFNGSAPGPSSPAVGQTITHSQPLVTMVLGIKVEDSNNSQPVRIIQTSVSQRNLNK